MGYSIISEIATGDTVTFNARVNSNIYPSLNAADSDPLTTGYDLGGSNNQWRKVAKEGDSSFIGFFEFKKINKIDIFNNWNCAHPENQDIDIRFLKNGEKIISNGISIKASEVLRNYGVDNAFRKDWPMIYVDNDLYWIVGLRKSDLAKENEKKSKKVFLQASPIKDNLYNLNNS